jgi:hypothetical protein
LLTLSRPLLSKQIHLLVKESFTFIYADHAGGRGQRYRLVHCIVYS